MIEVEQLGSVYVLHWHDDENRLNRRSLDALNQALDHVEKATGPCALVTTGEGKYYSNGLDLDWVMKVGDQATGFVDEVHRLLGRLIRYPAITVAAINGHAFGAGAMFATAHDFRVMREDRGYWCLPEADMALPLTQAMVAVVTAKLPRETAHEAIMTGQRYDAVEAQMAGIVNLTASEDDLLADAIDLATDFAEKNRGVVARHKQLLYGDALQIIDAPLPERDVNPGTTRTAP
jgi:enoyl-CoA hydratase/carnithine racemase